MLIFYFCHSSSPLSKQPSSRAEVSMLDGDEELVGTLREAARLVNYVNFSFCNLVLLNVFC